MKGCPILENLLCEDEKIAEFHTSGNYWYANFCIIPAEPEIDMLDIAACLEDTLHRLLDDDCNDEDIRCILGAIRSHEVDEDLQPESEWIWLDLSYVIPDAIISFEEMTVEEEGCA